MRPGLRGGYAPTGRAGDHPRPHEERFAHLFDGRRLLPDRDRQRRDPDRPPSETAYQRGQYGPVETVEPELVDVVDLQRRLGDIAGDHAVGAHLGVVADPA